MKRGKEMKIETPYQYNIISGTVDNKNPKSVYIQISAWGKPKDSDIDVYDNILRNKSKRVKKKLFEVLDDKHFHTKKSIVDFNMASSGVSYGKKSFMSVEMTLFKKEPLVMAHNTGNSLEDTKPDAFSALTAKSSPRIPAVFLAETLLIVRTSSIRTEISSRSAKKPEAIN